MKILGLKQKYGVSMKSLGSPMIIRGSPMKNWGSPTNMDVVVDRPLMLSFYLRIFIKKRVIISSHAHFSIFPMSYKYKRNYL